MARVACERHLSRPRFTATSPSTFWSASRALWPATICLASSASSFSAQVRESDPAPLSGSLGSARCSTVVVGQVSYQTDQILDLLRAHLAGEAP